MTLVEKIKALFEATPAENAETPAESTSTFIDVKANEGALLLRISALEVDGTVEVINEDGSLVAAGNDTYKLEDGTEIVVADGKIAEIATPEAEKVEDEKEAEMATETPATEFAEGDIKPDGEAPASEEIAGNLEKRVTALENRISELIDMVKGLNSSSEEMKNKAEVMSAENVELKAKNEELAKKVAAPAASFKKFEKPEIKIEKKKLSLVEKLSLMKENNK